MAHAAAHIKKARSEMDQPADLKALEKARERRRRSRERAERKRKVPGRLLGLTHPPPSHLHHNTASQHFPALVIPPSSSCHLCQPVDVFVKNTSEGSHWRESFRKKSSVKITHLLIFTIIFTILRVIILYWFSFGMEVASKEFFILSPVRPD